MKAIVFLLVLFCFVTPSMATEYPIVYSPLMYKQEGAVDVLSLNKLLVDWSKSINPPFRRNALTRFAKEIINFEIFDLTASMNHEIFGHGAVARELGGYSEYGFYWLGNWRGKFWSSGINYTEDTRIFQTTSGSEANQELGYESQKYLYTKDSVTSDDLFLLLPKLDFLAYLLVTSNPHGDYSKFMNSGYDPQRIVMRLSQKYYGANYTKAQVMGVYDQMLASSYSSLFDFGIVTGIYSIFAYTFLDKYEYTVPGFYFGKIKMIPGTRFTYTPLGPDTYLDFYFKQRDVTDPPLFIYYLRGGEFAGNGSWGTGFELYNLKKIIDGMRFDFWHQPDGNGFNLEMTNKIKINSKLSLLLDTYYKSRGYLIGKPYEKGLRAFGGVELVL